jgi:2-polyprenyl-6-methoxyphenol hydroxylase-like FAD-dependent oxidoreductase
MQSSASPRAGQTFQDVVIMGGGPSGLLAAILLGRRGHRITVVERDDAPPFTGPEAVFRRWTRRGVPQARQPHMFLGRAVRVLRQEAPDVLDDLLVAGALRLPVDLGDGPGDAVLCSRRLTFEAVLWRAAQRQPGVTMRNGAGVTDYLLTGSGTPRVRGVQVESGELLHADLVVDAGGRRSPTPRLFARHGLRPPAEVSQECGLLYISRYYRLTPGADFPSTDAPIMVSLGWATAMAFPADRRTFCLLAIVAAVDPLRRELTTDSGLARFHGSMPEIAPWLYAGRPMADIHTLARVDNRYRRLVDGSGPIAGGLVLLGDAAMHTNPTAGRGVSLAFAHVQHLLSALNRATSAIELTVDFDIWTDANIGAWYQLQAGADASLLRRAEAAVRGETIPPPDRMEQIRGAVIELSRQPSAAGLLLRRLRNLVALPGEVLSDPAVQAAADLVLARREAQAIGAAGPTRASFAAAA